MINDNTDCGNDQKKMSVKHWPQCNSDDTGWSWKKPNKTPNKNKTSLDTCFS